MKVYFEGKGIDLVGNGEAHFLGDSWAIRTKDGTFTGVAVQQGDKILVSFRGQVLEFSKSAPVRARSTVASGDIKATMPGLVVEIYVQMGEIVTKGKKLLIMEAMKTQQPIIAPFDGVVASLSVTKGTQVAQGDSLVIVEQNVSEVEKTK